MTSCYFPQISTRTSLSNFTADIHKDIDTYFFLLFLLHFPSPHHLTALPPLWKTPRTRWIWMPRVIRKPWAFIHLLLWNRCTTTFNSESLRKPPKVCQEFLSTWEHQAWTGLERKGGWRYTKFWCIRQEIGNCAAEGSKTRRRTPAALTCPHW